MSIKELTALLNTATLHGTTKAMTVSGIVKDSYSKSDAYRHYGRSNVDRWISEGLIVMDNKKMNRLKLEAVAAASNRHTYLPVAAR